MMKVRILLDLRRSLMFFWICYKIYKVEKAGLVKLKVEKYIVLVVSDSHGKSRKVLQAIKRTKPDMLIHLGDIEDNPDDIQDYLNKVVNEKNGRKLDEYVRSIYVKGNCDRFYKSKMTKAMVFDLNGHNVLVTHGHGFYVDDGLTDLLEVAKEHKCDMVMYGHTHHYQDAVIDGIRFLNPGSIAFPRRKEPPTYMVIEFDESGDYKVSKKIFWDEGERGL